MLPSLLLLSLLAATATGQITISEDLACTPPTSCKENNVSLMTIGSQACNEEIACSNNVGEKLVVGDGACNSADAISGGVWAGPQGGGKTCSFNTADVVVGNLGCTGVASCAYNSQQLTTGPGPRVCTGGMSCSNNTAPLTALQDSCKGTGSCSENGKGQVTVQTNGCYGEQSCRGGMGRADLSGCKGDSSCQEWNVDSQSAKFQVGPSSCSGKNSCLKLSSSSDFIIGEGSCTGENSCQNIVAANNFTIGDNACTAANSCSKCPDNVPDNAENCPGGGTGSSPSTPSSPSSTTDASAPAPAPNSGGNSVTFHGLGLRTVVSLILVLVGI